MGEPLEHAVGAELVEFAQSTTAKFQLPYRGTRRVYSYWEAVIDLENIPAKDSQLVVGHAHVDLVCLHVVLRDWLKLGSGDGFQESRGVLTEQTVERTDEVVLGQHREFERIPCVCNELLQIRFTDGPDRVYVR